MKLVISASRRTDIPAFYLKWFMEHIEAGFIDVPNPLNRRQVKHVGLSPREVAWIVFWSRNYGIFIKNHDFFTYYDLFFHFTINPSHDLLEPDMIATDEALKQLEQLVKIYGSEPVIWRYDPLVYFSRNGRSETNHDIQTFRRLVRTVSLLGLRRCYVSIAFLYPKVLKRARSIEGFQFVELEREKKLSVLQEMADLASLYGVQLYSCSNDALLAVEGLRKGQCINGSLLNRLGAQRVSQRQTPTRPDCGCTASVDIGDYLNTPCRYHCLYCYARQ
jgi:hypothetical protein